MKQVKQLLMLAICCLCSMALTAQTYTASGAGTAIPSTGTGGGAFPETADSFTFDVDAAGDVGSDLVFTVGLDIDHSWVSDLFIILESPSGVQSILSAGDGGSNAGYDNFTFDDASANADPVVTGGVLAGDAQAQFPMNIALSGPAAGTWTLIIYDQAGGDVGTFNSASMTFSPAPDNLPTNEQEINVAGITNINLTLTDECQGLVIPEMVLAGDFDADGDGVSVDASAFDIVVMDGNTSNGPIVDGCGSFQYRVTVRPPAFEVTNGFIGDFDAAGGNLLVTSGAEASATVTAASIALTSQSLETRPIFTDIDDASVAITFVESGFASFQFDAVVETNNGFYDFAVIDFEGNTLYQLPQLNTGGAQEGEGRVTELVVEPGNTLTFSIFGNDEETDFVSTFNIFDFMFVAAPTEVPVEVVGFTTTWGTVNAEDKTPPAVVVTPDDIELLCVDFDGNDLTTLPTSVSRCYMVNAQTGATVPGSMASALRARLLARTNSPVVPTFSDGCAARLEVCVNDVVTFGADENCDDITITRTFTATEVAVCVAAAGEGNPSVSTSFDLEFIRPSLADLDADNIQEVVEYERCGTSNPTRADYPAPRASDFPFLAIADRTFPLMDGEAVCNIGVTFSDGDPIVTCPFTYKFVRTYTVIDWCAPGDVRTFTQVVKVGDTTAPVFTGPTGPTNDAGELVYGTNAGNICAAYLRLDDVSAVDNCSGTNVSITATIYPGGDLSGTPIGAFTVTPGGSPELSSAIPAGSHILRYAYEDECGNTGTEDFDIVVEDQTPPVAICENGLNISIAGGANNGFAVLTPENIDNGSYDDCSGITRAIARVNSNDLAIGGYSDQITLTCADLGTVRVGLRVTDALGNENFCWLDVLVEDKLAPTCIAPGDVVITCEEYNTTLPADIMDATDETLDALFGTAAGVDNCGTTITQRISGDVNSCGVGRFTRTFVSTDDAGFTNTGACTQRIRVDGVHDYRLTFPTDVSSDCAIIPEYDGVDAEELACDLITTTTDVDTLRTLDAGDECFKLRVTYDVVNWCEYNSFGEAYLVPRDGDGVNNRQRQPRDLEADVLYLNVLPGATTTTTDDDRAFMTLFTDRVFSSNAPQRDQPVDDNNDDGDDNDYGDNDVDSRGFFRYVQFIKIYDEVAPVIDFTEIDECFAGSGEGCTTTVTIEFSANDACSEAVVGVELDVDYVAASGFVRTTDVTASSDDEGNFTVTLNNVPVGEHAIRVRASDGCGNFDVQIIEFCVSADRTPTPICIQTLTVTLMDDGNGGGIAAIWASDFIASPIVDCFGNLVSEYSLYRTSDAGAAGFLPSPGVIGIDDINCADRGDLSVRVYAFDDNGSTPDYCEVVVEVQDNAPHCGGSTGDLSGLIATDNNEAMANVSVTLTNGNGMEQVDMTGVDGLFSFNNLSLGGDYTVQPSYSAPFDGREVKTSDLVAGIAQILGTQSFDSPYDYIAADVNRDGDHDVRDIVASSRAILGLTNGYAAGNWVFVAADANIDMNNPYAVAFPEVYNVNDLAGNFNDAGFVAVMVGDLVRSNGRSAQTINVEDVQLEAGQSHVLVLDGSTLAGFQGTIELAAGLELVAADYTGEGALNLNNAAEGMIALAVRNEATVTLEVRATEAGLLSELVSLTDAITIREGVTAAGVSNGLALNFSGVATAELVNGLEQNTPNPVADVTTIAYTLAAAGEVTLNIQDVQGRTVLVRNLEGVAGRNVTTINVSELGGATGMLSYTLVAGDFSATKKMVVVR